MGKQIQTCIQIYLIYIYTLTFSLRAYECMSVCIFYLTFCGVQLNLQAIYISPIDGLDFGNSDQ